MHDDGISKQCRSNELTTLNFHTKYVSWHSIFKNFDNYGRRHGASTANTLEEGHNDESCY